MALGRALDGHVPRPYFRRELGFYVVHGGTPAKVEFSAGKIRVGCTDADPEALRQLLADYDRWRNGGNVHVHQAGC